MYNGKAVHVIIPAFNEQPFIAAVVRVMPAFVDKIIVVDDCSTDDTYGTAGSISEPRLIVLKTERNCGVGGAMKLGYAKGLELGADILVKVDGDGQMSPDHLPALLDPIVAGEYDYTKGNRFLHSQAIRQMPAARIIGNILLTFLTKAASGYWHVFDPQNGYTAIQADALQSISQDAVDSRFFFENDMLVQLNIQNFRVRDIAIPARYGEEISHLRISKILLTFPPLLARRLSYRIVQKYVLRDFSPIALFLLLGLPLFAWGVIFGLYLWVESMVTGQASPTGSIMLSLVPIVLGFQLILQAIVLDIQATPR